ncbi:hypothetical protein GWI33_023404 [Rhynchophorus ferrugineus]|uniref:Uncharacterized protein n=1 Tax=Rhynchophorus ferrugineus TaxID=354439 RepID=A0A834MM48_RHYFE|nr:hypothetical protein GWI33_023404 [Rhynchophorus ferrugineus]
MYLRLFPLFIGTVGGHGRRRLTCPFPEFITNDEIGPQTFRSSYHSDKDRVRSIFLSPQPPSTAIINPRTRGEGEGRPLCAHIEHAGTGPTLLHIGDVNISRYERTDILTY